MSSRPGQTTTTGAGQPVEFQAIGAPDEQLFFGKVYRLTYPITVVYDGVHPLVVPTLTQLLTAAFSQFSVRYGAKGDRFILPQIAGAELRTAIRGISRGDLPNDITNVLTTTTPSGNYFLHVDIMLPFRARSIRDGRKAACGTTQMRSVITNYVEGTGLSIAGTGGTSAITRTTNASMIVEYDYLSNADTAKKDPWAQFPTYLVKNGGNGQFYVEAVDGSYFLIWEASANQGGTALTTFTLEENGQARDPNIPPYIPFDLYEQEYLDGRTGGDITDTVTVVYSAPDQTLKKDLISGHIVLRQPQAFVSNLQLRGWYYPQVTTAEAGEAVAAAANRKKTPILGTVHADANAKGVSAHVAATEPIELIDATDPDFTAVAGLLHAPGEAEPTLSVPHSLMAAHVAKASVAGAAGPASLAHAQARSLEQITRTVPGMAREIAPAHNQPAAAKVGHITNVLSTRTSAKSQSFVKGLFQSFGL